MGDARMFIEISRGKLIRISPFVQVGNELKILGDNFKGCRSSDIFHKLYCFWKRKISTKKFKRRAINNNASSNGPSVSTLSNLVSDDGEDVVDGFVLESNGLVDKSATSTVGEELRDVAALFATKKSKSGDPIL